MISSAIWGMRKRKLGLKFFQLGFVVNLIFIVALFFKFATQGMFVAHPRAYRSAHSSAVRIEPTHICCPSDRGSLPKTRIQVQFCQGWAMPNHPCKPLRPAWDRGGESSCCVIAWPPLCRELYASESLQSLVAVATVSAPETEALHR